MDLYCDMALQIQTPVGLRGICYHDFAPDVVFVTMIVSLVQHLSIIGGPPLVNY